MAIKIVDYIKYPFFGPPVELSEESESQKTAKKVANLPKLAKVAAEYVVEPDGLKLLVVEPVVYSMRWVEIAFSALTSLLAKPQAAVDGISQVLAWVDLPTQMLKLYKSLVQLGESILDGSLLETADKTAKVYVNATYMLGLVSDAVLLLYHQHYIVLSAGGLAAMQALGFVGNIALLVEGIRGIKKQILKLKETEPWTPPFNLALLKLSARVALIVVAVFSIAAAFSSIVCFPWLILTFSTILFVLTLMTIFYEKMNIPEEIESG